MKLVFSSIFEADFAEIIVSLSDVGDGDLSRRFEKETYHLIELLQKFPQLGRLRRDLKPEGLRSIRVRGFKKYLLFYQAKGEELILWRLRHGGMNLPTLFLGFD